VVSSIGQNNFMANQNAQEFTGGYNQNNFMFCQQGDLNGYNQVVASGQNELEQGGYFRREYVDQGSSSGGFYQAVYSEQDELNQRGYFDQEYNNQRDQEYNGGFQPQYYPKF
jgi:hypothetical protein